MTAFQLRRRRPFWDEWRGSLDGRPVMWTKRLGSAFGWRLDIHKFVGPDDPGCFHTHPATAVRLVVLGGYTEEIEGGETKTWRPGRLGIVKPQLSHRVSGLLNGRSSYSLWLRGPKTHGIELHGDGWQRQRDAASDRSVA